MTLSYELYESYSDGDTENSLATSTLLADTDRGELFWFDWGGLEAESESYKMLLLSIIFVIPNSFVA